MPLLTKHGLLNASQILPRLLPESGRADLPACPAIALATAGPPGTRDLKLAGRTSRSAWSAHLKKFSTRLAAAVPDIMESPNEMPSRKWPAKNKPGALDSISSIRFLNFP